MGVLASQNSLSGESQLPQVKKPLNLSYNDFDDYPGLVSTIYNFGGDVIVGFIIDEHGKVIQPEIIDTFNLVLNDVIIDKVKQMKLHHHFKMVDLSELDINYQLHSNEIRMDNGQFNTGHFLFRRTNRGDTSRTSYIYRKYIRMPLL